MKKNSLLLFYTLVIFSLLGCTVEVNQPASPTPLPGDLSPAPTISILDANNTTLIPNTWADLNLNGGLVYSTVSTEGGVYTSRIQLLDLVSGESKTIFTSTGNAWIYYLTVSPDAKQLIMSYAPPSQPGAESVTSLYALPLEGTATPQILFTPPTPYDRYIQVEWSPDGQYIYFVHYNHNTQPAGQAFPDYQIFRMAYPDGQPQKILDQAFWPRISPDSSRLVYITLDPSSGTNQLSLANTDGSNRQAIMFSDASVSAIVDAPIFSLDGQSILFSAPSPPQAYQPNWLERLMGVQIASAHNVPSDWWSVPILGGVPVRLTHLQTIKLFASISPDGKHVASLSGDGIFVMDLDGSNLNRILFDPGVSSTVNWIP